MLQALLFVFKNYIGSHQGVSASIEPLVPQMLAAGFDHEVIEKTQIWLADYAGELECGRWLNTRDGHRVFSPKEYQALGPETLDTLASLCRHGILDAYTQELVISRLMGLGEQSILAYHVRCVVLLVLFSHPQGEKALAKMDYFVQIENDLALTRH